MIKTQNRNSLNTIKRSVSKNSNLYLIVIINNRLQIVTNFIFKIIFERIRLEASDQYQYFQESPVNDIFLAP